MKLKVFNTTNVLQVRTTQPFIHCNKSTGLICINKEAAAKLKLKPGDQVQFLQDESEEETWFLEKVAKDGFEVRSTKNTSPALMFNSSCLVRKIFESVAFEGKSGRLKIGEEVAFQKRSLITLITAGLRNTN
jgi:hypothetical protein